MNSQFSNAILRSTASSSLLKTETIQELWSGYGEIARYSTKGGNTSSVIIKHVKLPDNTNHPRGWNTSNSHNRKIESYRVETNWYNTWAKHCDENCRIPKCFIVDKYSDEVLIVMEDLDEAGFPLRLDSVRWSDIELCLSWLAGLHSKFMNKNPEGLWDVGTYWHLDTRPDELEELTDKSLKNASPKIDSILNSAKYKTFVHGDAKLANFCFANDRKSVAAVDFQYIGGGCGMKDIAYFVGSCLYEDDCEKYEKRILEYYFSELERFIANDHPQLNFAELETEWRELYPVAWTDFHRFLKGWSPSHWKINSYSERMSKMVITKLNKPNSKWN